MNIAEINWPSNEEIEVSPIDIHRHRRLGQRSRRLTRTKYRHFKKGTIIRQCINLLLRKEGLTREECVALGFKYSLHNYIEAMKNEGFVIKTETCARQWNQVK